MIQKNGLILGLSVAINTVVVDQAPWLLYDHVQFYQYVLIMVANTIIHYFYWSYTSKFTWRKVTGEWLHFTIALWTTWMLLAGSFTVGYEASGIADNWLVSIGTVVYLGIFYPFGKSALMWVLQKQVFWVNLRNRLKAAGADEAVMLGYQMNLYYLYDLLLSLAGKVLILRAKNLFTATRRVSPTEEGPDEVILPYYEEGESELAMTLNLNLSSDSAFTVDEFQEDKPSASATDQFQEDKPLEPRHDKSEMSLPIPAPVPIEKAAASWSQSSSLIIPINPSSLQHRIAQKIESRMGSNHNIEESASPSVKSRFLEFMEQTVVVLDLETTTPESIGICGIASITSDLFSKLTAAAIVYIMLGYNSTPWSTCHGVINLTTLTIEVCSTIAVTLLIDIPYTIYEMKDAGYNLDVVVETFSKVQLGWTLYAFLICAAGSCLSTFITAEVNMFSDSECFKKS
ncbi:hypothetical protein HDU76_003713 [Blyttiomyces sp. JEL0837]|nr:hypothetical protein HDU76_003713 [Blyttiomyces sp. JEL0837]